MDNKEVQSQKQNKKQKTLTYLIMKHPVLHVIVTVYITYTEFPF